MRKQKVTDNRRNAVRQMTRADIILILSCLLAAMFLSVFFLFYRRAGSMICISCGGIELYRINLEDFCTDGRTQYYLILYGDAQNTDKEQNAHIMHSEEYPEVPAEQGYNLFSVTDGVVTMEAADCRDQICVRHKPIGSDRECIICLPNQLVVEMRGATASGAWRERKRTGTSEDKPEETLDGVVG